MIKRPLLSFAAALLALGLAGAAHAAPTGPQLAPLSLIGGTQSSSGIEQATFRRCHWVRYCGPYNCHWVRRCTRQTPWWWRWR
jgi:hypothetical protein